MTSGAPWSVKGIDPKAREVAKDLARRSGMTLGEWLNRMILEDDAPEEITSQSYFEERPARSERVYLETPRAPEAAPVAVMEPPPGRFEAVQHPGDEMGRVAMALDRLSGKFDRAQPRLTPEAEIIHYGGGSAPRAARDILKLKARVTGAFTRKGETA